MSDGSNPPRPSLRQSVRDYIAGCVWNSQKAWVETTGGTAVQAWLNQTGNPGITATVQWEAGTSTELAQAVPASIPQTTFDAIKNGSFNAQTGLVTYQNVAYRFRFEIVAGVSTMALYVS